MAIVNQDVITRGELDQQVTQHMEKLTQVLGIEPTDLERGRRQIEWPVLNQMVDDRLLLQDAKKNNITATSREVDKRIEEKVKREYRPKGSGGSSTEEMSRILKEDDEVRTQVRNELIINKLLWTKYFQYPFVSPGELREYYRKHLKEFQTPSELTFRLIGVDNVPDAPLIMDKLDAELDKKRSFKELAQKIYDEQNDESFLWAINMEKIKMEALEDWLRPLPQILVKMKPGEIQRRIGVGSGWRYIEMVEVKPGKQKSFEEAQSEIELLIISRYREQERRRVVERLKKDAHLRYFLPPLPSPEESKTPSPEEKKEPSGKVQDVSPPPGAPKKPPQNLPQDPDKPK